MSGKDTKQQQPARMSERVLRGGQFETVEFAKRREKRRRARNLAKAARRKQRRS